MKPFRNGFPLLLLFLFCASCINTKGKISAIITKEDYTGHISNFWSPSWARDWNNAGHLKWDQLLGSVSLFAIHAKLGSSYGSSAHHLRYYRGLFRVAWGKAVVAKETETRIFLWNLRQDSNTRFQSVIYVVKRRSLVESLSERDLAMWLTKRYSITFRVFSSNALGYGGSLHGQVFFPLFSACEQSVKISISCHVGSSPIKLDTNEVTMNIITQTTEREKVTFGYWDHSRP